MAERRARRVVALTGASSGVGRATARLLGARGDHVALIARGRDGLDAAAREIAELGGKGLPLVADVAEADEVATAAETAESVLGPIDVWINNAMVSVFSPVHLLLPEDVRRVTQVTYLGTVYGTLTALRSMRERGEGTIVQVGSALAYRGIPLQAAYSGAKHAIQGFTESLRSELLHDKSAIKLVMVQLPALNTPHFDVVKTRLPGTPRPVPPVFEPEVAAEAIAWASNHPDRRELVVGWPTAQAIVADKIVPGLLDRYLASKGYTAQQTDEPVDPERANNLWMPLEGDRGAHGGFGAEARQRSGQLWVTSRRRALVAAAVLTGMLGVAAVRR